MTTCRFSFLYRTLLAAACIGAAAQQQGSVSVSEVWLADAQETHVMNVRLDTGTEVVMRHLLQSGYAVRFRLDLRLMRARNWLPDKELGDITWSPQISYNSLLNRYTFSAGGTVEEYAELSDAVTRAETFRTVPERNSPLALIFRLPEAYVLARYEMLIDHLPQPLQVSLLTGEWDISSGWRRFDAETRP